MLETAATVRDALRHGTAALTAAGCETPRLDAEVLLAFALGVDRSRLLIDDVPVPERFGKLLARRAAREPVAYITGVKAFRRLSLAVDHRVLIPRPETELLVEVGLGLPAGARVADVGTGSGAVALALKDERSDLLVTGIDVSADALAVARTNAARLGLDVSFLEADLLGGGSYDAVLANLPYVPSGTRDLPPEITRFEPAEALYGGDDGLDLLRRLVSRLDPGVSLAAFEVGTHQSALVTALLQRTGFRSIEVLRDLAGLERAVVGWR